jgi:23S rRNA pseudouridine2605 synthase
MAEERLQKVLSKLGFGSRRDCEKIIAAGRVRVNQTVARLGDKADPVKDAIAIDGSILKIKLPEKIYIAFNKPRRVLSDIKKPDDRKIVTDFVKSNDYMFIVGRLDYDSEGLILLTNDGVAANQLTHPRYDHEKEYLVELNREPDEGQLKIWRNGVVMEDGYRTMPAQVEIFSKEKSGRWLRVIIKEGKKRQIREIGERIGLPIKRIIRRRIGPIELGSLKPGEWRRLNSQEISKLNKSLKLST